MYDLPGPEELDDVVDVRIVGEAQDVVVGDTGLLLGGQILRQVGDQVALHRHAGGAPGEARRSGGVHAGGPVHKIRVKARGPDLLLGEVPGQLVDDGADHLQMAQLLSADVGQQALQLRIGHGVPLAQVAQGRAQLTVGPAVLGDDDGGQLGIGVLDLHRVLELLLINEHQSLPPSSQGHGSFSQAKPSSGVRSVCSRGPYIFWYFSRPSFASLI